MAPYPLEYPKNDTERVTEPYPLEWARTSPRRSVVVRNLPGLNDETYLDSEFAPKVDAFIQHARDKGVDLRFTSAYRSQAYQDYMRAHPKETGAIYPPAERSHHSAGRRR